jgi:hypothetical protein
VAIYRKNREHNNLCRGYIEKKKLSCFDVSFHESFLCRTDLIVLLIFLAAVKRVDAPTHLDAPVAHLEHEAVVLAAFLGQVLDLFEKKVLDGFCARIDLDHLVLIC